MYPSSYPSSSVGRLARAGRLAASAATSTARSRRTSPPPASCCRPVRSGVHRRRAARPTSPTPRASPASSPRSSSACAPLEAEVHRLVAFPDAAALGAALCGSLGAEAPDLVDHLPEPRVHPAQEAASAPSRSSVRDGARALRADASRGLPRGHRVSGVAPGRDRRARSRRSSPTHGGTELDAEAAEHEWEQRFAPMRLKRIGPSIVPTEVVVPLAEMPAVLDEIDEKIDQPFILEGMVGKGDKVVLLGFIPHDERSFNFNLAFALSLSVIKIAKAHGGAAYSTGLYFRREADSVLGAERVAALERSRREVDPGGVMNPGKVLGSGVIDFIMGSAAAFEPLVRPIANAAKPPSGPGDLSEGRQRHPRRRRLHGVRLRALRLLRAHVRAVLRPRLGEPVAARQVRLHPRGHGGPREVGPQGDRHDPRLHHLRGLQHALPAAAAHRAQLDGDARQAHPRGEARHVPAVRDDGRVAARRERHLGRQGRAPRRLGSRGRQAAKITDEGPTSCTSRAAPRASSRHGHRRGDRPPAARTPATTSATWARTRRAAASR